MNIDSRNNIVLPVEIQHREFDGKLLLACEIAERGKGAIIGSRVEIHKQIARLPFALYHAKDALKSSRRILRIIRDRGGIISLLDEEAAVYHNPDNYRERRLYGRSLNKIDQIFSWGEDSKKLVEDYVKYQNQPITVTGNPRMDLLRPELRGYYTEQATALTEKYGDFLLINTNFGKVNHFVESLSLDVSGAQNTGSEFMRGSHVHRNKIYNEFRKMLPRLASALKDVPIILRPHPAENQETWHSLLKPYKNVHILYEGTIVPWLLASKATLHNGCTTAVESFLLDKMAFCFQPLAPSEYDLALPNRLSREYMDIDKMIVDIKKQLKTGSYQSPTKEQRELADRFFASLRGRLASEEMAQGLIAYLEEASDLQETDIVKKVTAFLHAEGRAVVKRLNALNSQHKNSAKYTDHRFPGISLNAVRQQVAEYGALLDRFEDVEVRQISRHIFYLSKNSR